MRDIARRALEQYELEVGTIRLATAHWNTIFRVEARDGARYALRISRSGERDLVAIRSELSWVEALGRETEILVPEPIRTRSGELVCRIEIPGGEHPRYCALFRWIEGRRPRLPPPPGIVHLLGQTMARLHDHADTFRPPDCFTSERLDCIWTFGRAASIFSEEPHHLLSPERRQLLRELAEKVQRHIDALYTDPAGLRFLRMDLHLRNVKFVDGRMAVLDFDDSMWCYPIQDVGITLFYLLCRIGGDGRRGEFKGAYTTLRAWPEEWPGQVSVFIMARALDIFSFLLQSEEERQRERAGQILSWIEQHADGAPDGSRS